MFSLLFTDVAVEQIRELERDKGLAKRLKAVRKTLGLLETNPRHPGLQSHRFLSLSGPDGEDVYAVYAEQSTPAAYRVSGVTVPRAGRSPSWQLRAIHS